MVVRLKKSLGQAEGKVTRLKDSFTIIKGKANKLKKDVARL